MSCIDLLNLRNSLPLRECNCESFSTRDSIHFQTAVLPAQPTVLNILETWVQHFTTTQLTNIPDKPQRNKANNTIEKTVNDVNICREVADGLRIYFDFTLVDLLLYREEKEQYESFRSSFQYADVVPSVKEESFECVKT